MIMYGIHWASKENIYLREGIGYVWFGKVWGKMLGKENREEKKKRRESKGKLKIDLKLINYFYVILQTQFTYLTLLYKG